MARVTEEHRLNFEQAVFTFLNDNPSATTESVGAALYDDWRSPGPEGNRPKNQRATDWAKRKLKALAKSGKVYQPVRGQWISNAEPAKRSAKTTILRKKDRDNGKDKQPFSPISIFDSEQSKEIVDNSAFADNYYVKATANSPFIRGLMTTAERHGSVELSEPMLHALIEEMTMLLGDFDN